MGYQIGDHVRLFSDPSKVGNIEGVAHRLGPIQYYRVYWGGSHPVAVVAGQDLEPFREGQEGVGGWADFQRRVTYERLRRGRPLRNNIYAFNASRTRFFPYQFKPLLKFLDSPKPRLLIADEVGLGKTIEAGLILTELRARTAVRRVLVVCPASLREKWKQELYERFGEDEFEIISSQRLLDWLDEYDRDSSSRIHGIISLNSIRRENVLAALSDRAPEFDLTIVDEAHHMRNLGTLSRQAGVMLRNLSSSLLLLTATPVHLGDENLFSLLNILDEDEFPDIHTARGVFGANEPIVSARRYVGASPPQYHDALGRLSGVSPILDNALLQEVRVRLSQLLAHPDGATSPDRVSILRDLDELNILGHLISRTRKREVQDASSRRAKARLVQFTREEWRIYKAVSDYAREQARVTTKDNRVREWMVMTPQRRLASSIHAMVEYYQEHLLHDTGTGDDDYDDDIELDDDKSLRTKDALNQARSELLQVLAGWDSSSRDTKFDALWDILNDPAINEEKVIVFAFFKATLNYLARRLSEKGIAVSIIHGDFSMQERKEAIERFRSAESGVRVLLSSRVGSEGLDFQFCHVVVNYDLPWNPMEVEQRIGRVDRIGQQSPVIHICSLWIEGTIEERILRRLYERIRIFEQSIGALEGILGPVIRELEADVLSSELTTVELDRRRDEAIQRILRQKDEVESLEAQSAQLFSVDDYLGQEVNQIQSRRRFVSGLQMRAFVEDFLTRFAPSSALRSVDDDGQVYQLKAAESLQTMIKLAPRDHPRDQDWKLLSRYLGEEPVKLTFDGNIAFENPRLDFINVLHPLTRLICRQYERDRNSLFQRCVVELKTSLLKSGVYVFDTYLLHVESARSHDTLEFVVVDSQGECVLTEAECEELMGEVVERGRTPDVHPPLNEFDRLLEMAENQFWRRREAKTETAKRGNSLLVDRRVASLDLFFKRRILLVEDRICKAMREGRKESYISGLVTRTENLKAEWKARQQALDAQRHVSVSHEDHLICGILLVKEA